jgi:Tfp pilus assembly protein PilV
MKNEEGFLMIELITAILVLTIAVLALIGSYSLGYFALNSAGQTSSAGLLASNQLELYASLPYSSIGLDTATLASVKSTDANYSTDESALPVSGSDVTISGCGSSPQCSPVQTLTGGDHKTYKLETFIRLLPNVNGTGRSEKVVTEIVRNMSAPGSPQVAVMQTGFDSGP